MQRRFDVYYHGVEFYHTFYLHRDKRSVEAWDFTPTGNDLLIYGQWNHNALAFRFLKDLFPFIGKTVLDVGCRDGFYSLLFEKKGNKVTSMDVENRGARRIVYNHLNSTAQFINDNVYRIPYWTNPPKFDITFIGDLLVHLENPLGALTALHTLTKEEVYILSDFYPTFDETPIIQPNTVEGCPWHFSIPGLKQLIRLAGWIEPQCVAQDLLILPGGLTEHFQYPVRQVCLIKATANPLYKVKVEYSTYQPASIEDAWYPI